MLKDFSRSLFQLGDIRDEDETVKRRQPCVDIAKNNIAVAVSRLMYPIVASNLRPKPEATRCRSFAAKLRPGQWPQNLFNLRQWQLQILATPEPSATLCVSGSRQTL